MLFLKPVKRDEPSPDAPKYHVDCLIEAGRGSLSASHYYSPQGEYVQIYIEPADGYRLILLTAGDVAISGERSFIMPDHDVKIIAVFDLIEAKVNKKVGILEQMIQ